MQNKNYYTFILSLLLLLFTTTLSANSHEKPSLTIKQTNKVSSYDLASYLSYYEDKNGKMSFDEVLSINKNEWIDNKSKTPNFGYSKSSFWIHWSIKTTNIQQDNWIIELPAPLIDYISLYTIENNKTLPTIITGDAYPFSQRVIKHHYFLFPQELKANSEYHFYLKISGKNSMFMPLTLWESTSFWEHDIIVSSIIYICLGGVTIMFLYNLLLYVSLRKIEFFYYCMLIFAFAVFITSIKGVIYMNVTSNWPTFNQSVSAISAAMMPLFSSLFTIRFLRIKRKKEPINWYILRIFTILSILALISIPFVSYSTIIRILVFMTYTFYLYAFSITIWKVIKGNKEARFFVIGWSAIIAGYVTFGLTKLGIASSNIITENSILIGSVLEATLFSLALASRMKTLEEEKRDSKQAMIKAQKELNNSLEAQVAQRTRDLEQLKDKFEKASITDELTGLFNRRHFNNIIEQELRRKTREKVIFNFCLFDLDKFKLYNDRYGHPQGDKLLADISKLTQSHFQRASDFVFRLGGEEFGIIFYTLSKEESLNTIESFRQKIQDKKWKHESSKLGVVTASFGLLSVTDFSNLNMDEVYVQADKALYKAKETSRNCVCYEIYQNNNKSA